jgi:hypothetical protein
MHCSDTFKRRFPNAYFSCRYGRPIRGGFSQENAPRGLTSPRRGANSDAGGLPPDHAPTPARDFNTLEPDVMDETMTRNDIVFVLRHLHFARNGLGSLRLDRPVRDFLISALRSSRR